MAPTSGADHWHHRRRGGDSAGAESARAGLWICGRAAHCRDIHKAPARSAGQPDFESRSWRDAPLALAAGDFGGAPIIGFVAFAALIVFLYASTLRRGAHAP